MLQTAPAFARIATPAAPACGCAIGQHRPRRVTIGTASFPLRTVCRDCGCELVRTLASKRWFYSGPLA